MTAFYSSDPYGSDVLNNDPHQRSQTSTIIATPGLVLEDPSTQYVGEIIRVYRLGGQWQMELEDAQMHRRSFPLGAGFWLEGKSVTLLPPLATTPVHTAKTVAGKTLEASGSLHVKHSPRTAIPSRLWVEGKHDAQLIAKIWGADLAYCGVMVEELFGADNLLEVLTVFSPSNTRRAGILLDHLVPGSKEWKIAQEAEKFPGVKVLGHPFVDIWQAIKPQCIGIKAWPTIPHTEDIKAGTLQRLGMPYHSQEDIGLGWQKILNQVHSYKDLDPALLSPVEALIDFITVPEN